MAELGITIKTDFDGKGLNEANKKIGNFLKAGLKAGGVAAAGALGAVGVGAAAAAAQAINFAEESNAAMDMFARQTGLSEESVQAFNQSAKDLFAEGYGEDIGEISEAMAEISNVMQSGAKETEAFTRRALAMRDVFDKDISESTDAVKVLMDEFGLSSEQAFDFLAKGIQDGLDRSGDFLDTVREYGNVFGQTKFDAAQFYSILESGSQGGVLGTDKMADAFKEYLVIMNEAGPDAVAAFEEVTGYSFERVAGFIQGGDEDWSDYFKNVVAGINSIEDPMRRAQLQTELFGTMAEDLGVSFTEGLSESTTSLEDMAGTMDLVVDKNANISESMENLRRQMVVALEPAAQVLLPLLAQGIRHVGEFMTAARPIFTGFANDLSQTLGPAMLIIGDSLIRIADVFGLVEDGASGMDAALQLLEKTLGLVVTAIEAVAVVSKFLADAFEMAAGLLDLMGQISAKTPSSGGPGSRLFPNLFGFQEGGIVPGTPSQASPIIAHGGEEIANPAIGQAIVIEGEQFAVREAERLAAAINRMRQHDMQMLVDGIAAAL